jgi:hypothetical protein
VRVPGGLELRQVRRPAPARRHVRGAGACVRACVRADMMRSGSAIQREMDQISMIQHDMMYYIYDIIHDMIYLYI